MGVPALLLCLLAGPAAFAQERAPAPSAPAGAPAAEGTAAGAPAEDTLLIGERARDPRTGAPAAAAPLLSAWDFLRMILVLALIVGLIYGLFYLLKRGRGGRTVENDLIRLIGSRTLSGNRALHLVQVGASVFLVGAAEGGITLISELKDKETIDRIRVEGAREAAPPARSFAAILQGLFRPAAPAPSLPPAVGRPAADGGARSEEPAPADIGATVDYIRKQQERLKRM